MIEVKPVKKYNRPRYPDRVQVVANPDMLKHIPKRWVGNPVVLTALGLTITLSSCDTGSGYGVAPIFDHGIGRGSFGCSSVVAPYFYSEEDALDIIRDEAEKYGGLELSTEMSPRIDNVKIKPPFVDAQPVTGSEDKRIMIELETDAWNEKESIAIEFVSKQDLESWQWKPEETEMARWSSVSTYEFKDTATNINTVLNSKKPDMNIGVFYDPYSFQYIEDSWLEIREKHGYGTDDADYDAIREETFEVSKEVSEENLRAQVRDFIDWLKAQGVI